jgi:hypothetical protein
LVDYYEVSEERKEKLVSIRLKGRAFYMVGIIANESTKERQG